MKTVVAISHASTWLLTQTAVYTLLKHLPIGGVEIIVVDNSWLWSPSARCITDTDLGKTIKVIQNRKPAKHHASGLDYIIANSESDLFFALETDVVLLRPDWLDLFLAQLKPSDFAVGAWHHEQFINPSCTLYRTEVLNRMLAWCRSNPSPIASWGPDFTSESTLYQDDVIEQVGPFDDRRGWPRGTVLKHRPSGQLKGPGHYEPGQMLFHWATNEGYTYSVIPTRTERDEKRNIPTGTFYGEGDPFAVHLWAGTRALDILKHPVTDPVILKNTQYWANREVDYWKRIVPDAVQEQTIKLIYEHGWYNHDRNDREKQAESEVTERYRQAGLAI